MHLHRNRKRLRCKHEETTTENEKPRTNVIWTRIGTAEGCVRWRRKMNRKVKTLPKRLVNPFLDSIRDISLSTAERELIDALSAVPRRVEAINLYDFGRKIRDEDVETVESAFYAVSKIKNRLPER